MRVLLDTNVLAVGMTGDALGQRNHCALIWGRFQSKDFDVLISTHLLAELDHTWSSKWFQDRLTPDELTTLRFLLMRRAILVEITHEVRGVASHWQDDLVLAAAVSGKAAYLVTRDKEFRRVDEYQGVRIRTPAEFLSELDASRP